MKNENELSLLSAKLESHLKGRARNIQDSIAQINRTGSLLDDYIKPVRELEFSTPNDVIMSFNYYDDVNGEMVNKRADLNLHPHAVTQIAEKFGVPAGYLRDRTFGESWERNLGAHIMQKHADNTARERVLIRSIEGQVRGFLTDKYRRLNSMEIFLAFLMAAQATKSVLVDAHAGETKGFLEVINPNIVEFDTPLNGRNYACIGARIRNSDFGDGKLELYLFALMVQCMNGIVGESKLAERHLGGRIPDDIEISEETYKKDTAAKASLVTDVMKQIYTPDVQNGLISKIQGASATRINIVKEVEKLPKIGLTIDESKTVGKLLMENDPANGLAGEPTMWKLVQGLTAMARDAEPERKRSLELIASGMLI